MKFLRTIAILLVTSMIISFSTQIIYAKDIENLIYHIKDSQNISEISESNDISVINQAKDITDNNQDKNIPNNNLDSNTPDHSLDNNTPDHNLDNNTPDDNLDNNTPNHNLDNNTPNDNLDNNTSDHNLDNNTPDHNLDNNTPDHNLDNNTPDDNLDNNTPDDNLDNNTPNDNLDNNTPNDNLDNNTPNDNLDNNTPNDNLDNNTPNDNQFHKLKREIESGNKDTLEIKDDIIFDESINISKPITIEGILKNDGSKPKLIIEFSKASDSSFRHFIASENLILKNLSLVVDKPVNNQNIKDSVKLGGITTKSDLHIEDCDFINNSNVEGGAIYSTGNIELYGYCNFIANKATQSGGGIYCTDNIIINNSAKVEFKENIAEIWGGAIYSENKININKSSEANFNKNQSQNGGAIYCTKAIELYGYCNFIENKAVYSGGAICLYKEDDEGYLNIKGKSTFHNNIANNRSSGTGGAIYSNSIINISNVAEVKFTENEAKSRGGAIYISPYIKTRNKTPKNTLSKINIEDDAAVEFIENKASVAGGAIYAYLNVDLNFNSQNIVRFENNSRLDNNYINGNDLFLFCDSKSYMKNTIFESDDKNNDPRIFICNNFSYYDTIQNFKMENSEVNCTGSFIQTSAPFSEARQNYILTFNKVIFENLSSVVSTIRRPEPVVLNDNTSEDNRFTLSLKINNSSFITEDLDIIFFFKEEDGFENYLYSIFDLDLTNNTFIINNKFSINSLSTAFEHNTLKAKEISSCLFGNFANNIIISDTKSSELVEHLGKKSNSIDNFNSHYKGEITKLLNKETRGSLFWKILNIFEDNDVITPTNNAQEFLAEKYLALIFKKNEINVVNTIIDNSGADIDKNKLKEFSKLSKTSLFEDIKNSYNQLEEGNLKDKLKLINENIKVLEVDNFYLVDQLDIEKVLEDKTFEFDLIVNKNIKHYEPCEDSLANGFEMFNDITEDAVGRNRFPKSTLGSIQGKDIDKVKILFTAGDNGSLLGKTSFRLNKGSKWTMIDVPKAVPNNGYRFSGWTPKLKDDSYIINDDLEFKAKFERKPSSGGSGGGSGGSDKEPDKKPEKEIEKPKDRNGRELGTILEEKVDINLNKKDHFAYVKGYGDGTVRPTRDITREEVAIIVYRLIQEKDKEYISTSEHNFSDVESNRWSEKAIASLAKVGIIKGYENGSFKPTKSITRSEAAKIIGRFTDTVVCETNFPDILDHWAEDYINSVEAKGWIKGYSDGTFKPNNNITRAEYVTLMNNLLERKVKIENTLPGIKQFNDLNTNKWYYEQMIEALNGHEYEKLEDKTGRWIKLIDKYFE